MARRARYTLQYANEVYEHLDFIEKKYHRAIASAIQQQLTHTPETPTQNRKPLETPTAFGATWELRCGPQNAFRVFYEVEAADRTVTILAVGRKERNRLYIGGEEFAL